jgi:starch-binding outer membrane protein, SusD/RagB family
MKKLQTLLKIFMAVLLLVVTQPSCTNLDEKVYSDLTADKLFSDPDNLIYAFGVGYTSLYALIGHKYGMIGKECGTDILCVPQRGGDWLDGGEWHRLHRHTWTSDDSYCNHWWQNIYGNGITNCNKLIFQFENQGEGVDFTPAISELRALRALYYYWLIDLYGNVPIVDRIDGPTKPATNSRKEVYDFIEKELTESMPYLSKETGLPMYGRINYYTAQMILAKLYLNAAVYTGTPQWELAMNACDTIISSGKYTLESDFFSSFVADASGSQEVIMGIPFDQIAAPQFEIHLFTLHYSLPEKFGIVSASWNGVCFQESFFNLFEETDIRRNGLLFGPQFFANGDPVTDPSWERFNSQNPSYKDPDGANLNLTPHLNMLEPYCLRQQGARVAKFPFIEGSDRYTSNDFPVFRYADVLLMKAELLLRLGRDAEALPLVNDVRARAEVDPFTEVTFQNLLEERGRELYCEGHRRSDMIRFSDVIPADNELNYFAPRWEKTDVSPGYTSLWPVPKGQINVNENLVQNDGY